MLHKVNNQISNQTVRLIFNDGSAELTTLTTALQLAAETSKDVIEVAVQGQVSVVKLGSAYAVEKEEIARQKKLKRPKVKEFKFSLAISESDKLRKIESARKHLETPGTSVQLTLVLKGRQKSNAKRSQVESAMESILDQFTDVAAVISRTYTSVTLKASK